MKRRILRRYAAHGFEVEDQNPAHYLARLEVLERRVGLSADRVSTGVGRILRFFARATTSFSSCRLPT